MFSSLRFKGTLHIHAAYPIVCFPVLVRTFFYVKGLFRCIPGIVFMYITGTLLVALAGCITFRFINFQEVSSE